MRGVLVLLSAARLRPGEVTIPTMEIEAKFSAPDAATLERLARLGELAGYKVAGGELARHDRRLSRPDDRAASAGRPHAFGGVITASRTLSIAVRSGPASGFGWSEWRGLRRGPGLRSSRPPSRESRPICRLWLATRRCA